MTEPEEVVVAYLRTLSRLEPRDEQVRRLDASLRSATTSVRRRVLGTRRALLVAAILVVGGATALSVASGLSPWGGSAPVRVDNRQQAPDAVKAALAVLRQPPLQPRDSEAEAAAVAQLRSPWVVYRASIRAAGATSLGDPIYVMYAKMAPTDVPKTVHVRPEDEAAEGVFVGVAGSHNGAGSDGPYPLKDIQRGTAFGITELSSVQLTGSPSRGSHNPEYFTAMVPDGVSALQLSFRDGTSQSFNVVHNVATGGLKAGSGASTLRAIHWLARDGSVIRSVEL